MGTDVEAKAVNELELTHERYLKLWFAYYWRQVVGAIIIFLIGHILERLIGPEASFRLGFLISLIEIICGIAISFTVLKWGLLSNFKEFRIALVQREPIQGLAEAKA
jgi:hypothetical protein